MTRLLALSLLVLAGCSPITLDNGLSGVTYFRDQKNGCEYVMLNTQYGAAITPRLSPDGTQICTRKDEE